VQGGGAAWHCADCRRRHWCTLSGTFSRERFRSWCADCRRALRHARAALGRGGRRPPPGLREALIEKYAARAALELPLFDA
jgi:hypothetical protein